MSASPLKDVVAHWHKLIESFQTSPSDFYDAVEEGLARREIPGLKVSRVKWNQGSILSPERVYLRVTGERHCFDMCAAPFGTGFFFSSWVTKRTASFVPLYLVGYAFATYTMWRLLMPLFGWLGGLAPFVVLPVAIYLLLLAIGTGAAAEIFGPAEAIRTVPLIGWAYERMFTFETYYRVDTMLMFQSAVHTAMLEAIDDLTKQKGLRALSDAERKPIFRELTAREPEPALR